MDLIASNKLINDPNLDKVGFDFRSVCLNREYHPLLLHVTMSKLFGKATSLVLNWKLQLTSAILILFQLRRPHPSPPQSTPTTRFLLLLLHDRLTKKMVILVVIFESFIDTYLQAPCFDVSSETTAQAETCGQTHYGVTTNTTAFTFTTTLTNYPITHSNTIIKPSTPLTETNLKSVFPKENL